MGRYLRKAMMINIFSPYEQEGALICSAVVAISTDLFLDLIIIC
jgi:hypothetical protein